MRRKFASLTVLAVAALVGCKSTEQPDPPAIDHFEITLAPVRASYPVRDTVRASFVAIGRDGTWMPTGPHVWRSLTPLIASVNGAGLITGLSRGMATIELEVDGTKGQIQVPIRGILHTERLDANETWLVADTPHVVQGYFNVGKLGGGSATVVLTIDPGVTVRFRPRAGLMFGDIDPGALVIPAGGDPVVMEGDVATRGSWVGLAFKRGRSELRKLTIRHCGNATPWDAVLPCLFVGAGDVLLDDVTVSEARDGVHLSQIAPGSRALSIHNTTGYAAMVAPQVAAAFPRGGTFSGNVENEIRITGGRIEQSSVWSEAGMPWRLSGPVELSGAANPVLTIPAGLVIRADAAGALTFATGGLIAGATGGAPLVIESTGAGWGGIAIEHAEGSALRNVTLRDCGGAPGASNAGVGCLSVEGDPAGDAGIILEDVTIRGARSAGISFGARGHFHATSRNIVIRETQGVPIELWPESIPSIPTGEYGFNDSDAIRLRGSPTLVWETATWRNVGVPYLAPNGIVVESSIVPPTLTIEPGVVVRLGLGTTFTVGIGRLQAVGTAASPIVFTSVTPGVAGSWMGIELANWDTPFLRLEHVEIADAGNGPSGFAGALRLNVDPGGVIRNSIIRRSPSCGVILLAGQWSSDYASPAFGNTFVNVAGPATCRVSP